MTTSGASSRSVRTPKQASLCKSVHCKQQQQFPDRAKDSCCGCTGTAQSVSVCAWCRFCCHRSSTRPGHCTPLQTTPLVHVTLHALSPSDSSSAFTSTCNLATFVFFHLIHHFFSLFTSDSTRYSSPATLKSLAATSLNLGTQGLLCSTRLLCTNTCHCYSIFGS